MLTQTLGESSKAGREAHHHGGLYAQQRAIGNQLQIAGRRNWRAGYGSLTPLLTPAVSSGSLPYCCGLAAAPDWLVAEIIRLHWLAENRQEVVIQSSRIPRKRAHSTLAGDLKYRRYHRAPMMPSSAALRPPMAKTVDMPPTRNLLLITASSPDILRVRRSRVLNFQQVTMPYLAAFVPPHWSVRHIDEAIEPIDFGTPTDVVAMTFHTPSAQHAYDIADRFRRRGVTVALGGPHVTLMPDEAQSHADAIFVGEAESTWPEFLADFETGRYRSRYCCDETPSLDHAPASRHDLFHRRDHTSGALFATRGCVYRCDFCTLAVMYRSQLRKRPVEAVAAEYASFPGKVVILWDDNIAGDIPYAKTVVSRARSASQMVERPGQHPRRRR